MDLRYCVPPLMNLISFLFLSHWNSNLDVSSIFVQQFSILELAFLILALMFLLLFLFISAELPLNLTPIRFRAGDFSIGVATSLLASLFFPPSVFWPFHFFIVVSSPCRGMFFDLFKHFFRWFSGAIRSLPTNFTMIITQNEESSSSAPVQDDVELGLST